MDPEVGLHRPCPRYRLAEFILAGQLNAAQSGERGMKKVLFREVAGPKLSRLAKTANQPVQVPGCDAETENTICGCSALEEAVKILGEIPRRIQTVASRIFLGEVRVEILQGSTCQVAGLQRAGEQMRS